MEEENIKSILSEIENRSKKTGKEISNILSLMHKLKSKARPEIQEKLENLRGEAGNLRTALTTLNNIEQKAKELLRKFEA